MGHGKVHATLQVVKGQSSHFRVYGAGKNVVRNTESNTGYGIVKTVQINQYHECYFKSGRRTK
ncbi:MAG: hypothetical protein RLZ92_1849 [Pseudomonadota bacterium]|jgi:hypothetical protein